LEDLGKLILEGLKIVGDFLSAAWNAITDFVTDAFQAVLDLARAIGGAIADVLDSINDAIDSVQATISDGINVVVGFFDGNGAGALGSVVGAIGDVLNFAIDKFQQGVDILIGIFRGNWKAVGDAAANFFGFSKSVSKRKINAYSPERFWDEASPPGPFPCPLRYNCKSVYGRYIFQFSDKLRNLLIVDHSQQLGRSVSAPSVLNTVAKINAMPISQNRNVSFKS